MLLMILGYLCYSIILNPKSKFDDIGKSDFSKDIQTFKRTIKFWILEQKKCMLIFLKKVFHFMWPLYLLENNGNNKYIQDNDNLTAITNQKEALHLHSSIDSNIQDIEDIGHTSSNDHVCGNQGIIWRHWQCSLTKLCFWEWRNNSQRKV